MASAYIFGSIVIVCRNLECWGDNVPDAEICQGLTSCTRKAWNVSVRGRITASDFRFRQFPSVAMSSRAILTTCEVWGLGVWRAVIRLCIVISCPASMFWDNVMVYVMLCVESEPQGSQLRIGKDSVEWWDYLWCMQRPALPQWKRLDATPVWQSINSS